MGADTCFWCGSTEPVGTDDEGDGCCGRCAPLLDPDGICGYCGEGTPLKMVGNWPACGRCLDAFREGGVLGRDTSQGFVAYRLVAQARALTTKERIEALARDAGVTGDIWHLSLADFANAIAEARCTKLGLRKADPETTARQYEELRARNVVANEGGR